MRKEIGEEIEGKGRVELGKWMKWEEKMGKERKLERRKDGIG